jgi:two-component system, OmpR family, response regulator
MTKNLDRILYAEDEDDIRLIATMALETFGNYVVETCESGAGIVEKAHAFKPDLFLLDVMMPDVDGIAALEAITSTPELKNIPVVFMTAKVQPGEIQRFRELGATDVLSKPFDPQELSANLQAIWEKLHE